VTRTFKISNDKNFEKKFWDVIGLYLNPPDRALVLCCDVKSQCQALEVTQPSLLIMLRYRRTQTQDYKRHGIVLLIRWLYFLDGSCGAILPGYHRGRCSRWQLHQRRPISSGYDRLPGRT